MNMINLESEQSERTLALLALAATNGATDTICPPDEKLAAFLEGNLKRKEHKAMVSHLSRCHECYYHWQEAYAIAEEFESYAATSAAVAPSKEKRRGFSWLIPNWNFAMPAIAAAALSVLVIVMLPGTSDLNHQLDSAYMTVAANNSGHLKQNLGALNMPWETTAFSFDSHVDSVSASAFATGLIDGMNEISGDKIALPDRLKDTGNIDWDDSQWQDYYNLGRWTLLSWSLSKSDQGSADDWLQIQKVSQDLAAQFKMRPSAEHHAQLAMNALTRIDPIVAALAQQPSMADRSSISRRLEMTMQQFFAN